MVKRSELHGLVLLPSVGQLRTGAGRPISHAERPLRALNVRLHFAAVWSAAHFAASLMRLRRLQYDFVLFNGLASLSHRSRFGYPLARIVGALRVPTFIYWHETDWVLDRLDRTHSRHAARVRRVATTNDVVHLAVSEACKQSLEKHFADIEPIVAYNCTSVPEPFDRPVSPGQPPTVINLASIQERKGTDLFVETAIKVCQQHPTVEFIWLGDGQPFGSWQADIERAGLQERILFPGYVDAAYLILRRASALFLSSRDDPFPLTVLEAMCLGRDIVTFDVGGAPEALAGLGRVIPPFDTELAADAILHCLRLPPERRINQRVRQRYLDLYTPQRLAERLDRILREQLGHEG